MIRRDQATASTASTLFARKGEAVPVGGREAPRRVITMRPFMAEHDTPIAPPLPANTSRPASSEPRQEATPSNVLPFAAPAMGPAVGVARIYAAPRRQTRPGTATAAVIRSPVRHAATELSERPAMKRTTIRLDAALRARLADFSASETLSVQALLTRALKRHLPALTVEQPMAHNQGLPRAAGARAMRRSVRFDPHLYWRLKTAAGKRGRSMQSIMVAALEAYLDAFEADGETHKAAHLSVVA